MPATALWSYLVAGALSGITGLLVFLLIHHLWIQPIWFIFPFGLVVAIAGGLAVGWSFFELAPGLPAGPWTALAWVGLIVIILLPSLILAELRAPMFDINSEPAALAMSRGRAAVIFISELVLTATLVGAAAGWFIGKTPQAAAATALAGLIFALGPGHNIPFIGSTPGVPKEIAIMGAVIVVSAIVLVAGQSLLAAMQPAASLGALD